MGFRCLLTTISQISLVERWKTHQINQYPADSVVCFVLKHLSNLVPRNLTLASQKEHTEIHKIPKFGVNQASFD